MPARKRNGLSENTRERIKTSMIVNRLTDHIVGKCEMSSTQVQAARILLDRTLPAMSQVEHKGNVEHHYVVQAPEMPSNMEEWKQKYGPQTIQ